jgi:transcriptional regulator of arginine metabolism
MEVIKRLRQQQIRDLITTRTLRTQHELAAALRERGFRATQATVSRDVTEMGLIKLGREGTRGYALPPRVEQPETTGEERLAMILRDLPVDVRQAGLLLVVRAVPGSAHAVAAALDRTGWPEVAGSIAGDDTVFVACTDRAGLERIHRRLIALARLAHL